MSYVFKKWVLSFDMIYTSSMYTLYANIHGMYASYHICVYITSYMYIHIWVCIKAWAYYFMQLFNVCVDSTHASSPVAQQGVCRPSARPLTRICVSRWTAHLGQLKRVCYRQRGASALLFFFLCFIGHILARNSALSTKTAFLTSCQSVLAWYSPLFYSQIARAFLFYEYLMYTTFWWVYFYYPNKRVSVFLLAKWTYLHLF